MSYAHHPSQAQQGNQNSSNFDNVATDGLPKQFLSSLKILFDILDESRSGYIRLRDIECRWSDDGVRGLPPGVVDGLRKVTPPNGLLSFDRFVAGLKLVLTKKQNENEQRKLFLSKENRVPLKEYQGDKISNRVEANRAKYGNDLQTNIPVNRDSEQGQRLAYSNTASNNGNYQGPRTNDPRYQNDSQQNYRQPYDQKRRPSPQNSRSPTRAEGPYNSYMIKSDVSAYPGSGTNHHAPSGANVQDFRRAVSSNPFPHSQHVDNPPAVPPRGGRPSRMNPHAHQMKKSMSGPDLHSRSPPVIPPREIQPRNRVLNELKNWQKEWTASQSAGQIPDRNRNVKPMKATNADSAIYANIEQFQRSPSDQQQLQQAHPKATVKRHGSGRRHTLANGIDQNMLKRMKQLEEEAAMLRSGMSVIDSAREWYRKQLASVADKQAMLGKVNYMDNSLEAHQERMNFQRARISEVNQHLKTLLESSEKGFPLHMNLALTNNAARRPQDTEVSHRDVQEQNRKLREDVNQKKDQITQLEKEKASLVRELFEARSKHKTNYDDTTFM